MHSKLRKAESKTTIKTTTKPTVFKPIYESGPNAETTGDTLWIFTLLNEQETELNHRLNLQVKIGSCSHCQRLIPSAAILSWTELVENYGKELSYDRTVVILA